VSALSRRVDEAYDFYEIICVSGRLDAAAAAALRERLSGVRNVRLLAVASDAEFDDLLAHGLNAAIGDFVVAIGVGDASAEDAVTLVETCLAENADIVRAVARPPESRPARARIAVLRRLLLAVAGCRINPLQRRAFCISRRALAKLGADRHEGRHFRLVSTGDIFAERELVVAPTLARRGWREELRRLRIVAYLASLRTPAFLTTIALVALFCSMVSVLFGVYVVAIWTLKSDVAAGWASLSLVTAFASSIGFAVMGAICLGLAQLLKALRSSFDLPPVQEFSTADLFSRSRRLNVEIELGQGMSGQE
jgi:hypothetical protein